MQVDFTSIKSQMEYRTSAPDGSRGVQNLLIASTIQSFELAAKVFAMNTSICMMLSEVFV